MSEEILKATNKIEKVIKKAGFEINLLNDDETLHTRADGTTTERAGAIFMSHKRIATNRKLSNKSRLFVLAHETGHLLDNRIKRRKHGRHLKRQTKEIRAEVFGLQLLLMSGIKSENIIKDFHVHNRKSRTNGYKFNY